jgi:hypothetical protein
MVVDVRILMDKHIVHVQNSIVVDDVNSDLINIIMFICTTIHIIMAKNKLTFFFNESKTFFLNFNMKIK